MTATGWTSPGTARSGSPRRAMSIGAFVVIIVVIGIATAALVQVLTPAPAPPTCVEGRPCAGPPAPPGGLPVAGPDTAPALATGQAWRSTDLGFAVEFEPDTWAVADEDGRGVILAGDRALPDLWLWIGGTAAGDATPDQALAARLDALGDSILGLAEDADPAVRIMGPNIGYVHGIGAVYGGASTSAQGPSGRARVAVMSASDGHLTLTASLVLIGGNGRDWLSARQLADTVLNTVAWTATATADPGRAASGSPGRQPGKAAGGSNPSDPSGAGAGAVTNLGPAMPDTVIELTLALQPRDPDGLAGYASGVADPASPDYGRTLSPAEIGARFGPTPGALHDLDRMLAGHGLAVVGRAPQRTTMRVRGPVQAVEEVFATRMERFRDATGRTYLAPTVAPTIPGAMAGAVDGVLGLDGGRRLRPASGWRTPAGAPLAPGSTAPRFGLRPDDVAAAYDILPLRQAGFDGTGETIAIVSFDAIDDATIAAFDRSARITAPPVVHVDVNGGTEPGDGSSEVALDIEVIRSIAPKARILDFEAPNGQTSFADIVDAIVADGRARTISISWGQCDDASGMSNAARRADERSFQAAVAAGVTIFVATGDFGAFNCRGDDPADLDLTTDWPSGSQYVVAVGGTRLEIRTSSGYLAEEGWEDALEGSGGGGGIALREPQPAWQKGPGVARPESDGHRQVPDVAAASDPDSGFFTVWRDDDADLVQGSIGGTSAATPFWAASTALIRQAARAQGKTVPGLLAPLLYQVAASDTSAFHDVVRGGNLGYQAGPGWDFSTGLGSPDVARLANALIAVLP